MNDEQTEALADAIERLIDDLEKDFKKGRVAFLSGDYRMARIHFEPGPYEHLLKLLETEEG